MCIFCLLSYSLVSLHATWRCQIVRQRYEYYPILAPFRPLFFQKQRFYFILPSKDDILRVPIPRNYTKGKRTTSAFNRRPRTSTAISDPALAKAGLT